MNKYFKLSAIAAGLMASGVASADLAETKGGLKIKTDDGRFEMSVGGRLHLDYYGFFEDAGASYGSSSVGMSEQGGFNFRRTYLTLQGKLYGWKYKFENDFSAGASPASIREMWVSTELGPGELILGQFKPFRGMEELTSSNEITMIERPVTTATGIYAGRQFLMGAGYKGIVKDINFMYAADYMTLGAVGGTNATNEGQTFGGRLVWAPIMDEGAVLHVGFSGSLDDGKATTGLARTPSFAYAGRRSSTITFGTAGAANGANIDAGNDQRTLAVELAGAIGPVTLQGEYATANLDNTHTVGGIATDSTVDAYSVMASWMITGESKPYKLDRGAFGNPKPTGDYGAWEVALRYEGMQNRDQSSATNNFCNVGNASGAAAPNGVPTAVPAGARTKCEIQTITAGVNWYLNPNVRVMLNYYVGNADLGVAGTSADNPHAVTLRTQLSF